eukprot:1395205-Amorphochlora_amoeboformis.AAC.1
MEKENDDMTDKLASKVEMLRQVGPVINRRRPSLPKHPDGVHIPHNSLSFSFRARSRYVRILILLQTSAGDIMGSFKGTMKGLATLATSGGTQALLVKSMGLFGFFLVVYYLSSRYTADP